MPYYDHDKDYPFAAFITNLGKYNEGELVGEWPFGISCLMLLI